MRDLKNSEFIEALKRHQKNFKNCSFELSEDCLRVKKKGLKVPVPKKTPVASAVSAPKVTSKADAGLGEMVDYQELFGAK